MKKKKKREVFFLDENPKHEPNHTLAPTRPVPPKEESEKITIWEWLLYTRTKKKVGAVKRHPRLYEKRMKQILEREQKKKP